MEIQYTLEGLKELARREYEHGHYILVRQVWPDDSWVIEVYHQVSSIKMYQFKRDSLKDVVQAALHFARTSFEEEKAKHPVYTVNEIVTDLNKLLEKYR